MNIFYTNYKNIFLILALGVSLFFTLNAISNTLPPVPLTDDNGNRSFVKQLLPKLLGRKPKGMLEVNMLADIAGLHGRTALVEALMELPEFQEHWTALLVDHLQVKRESIGSLPGTCFNDALLSPLQFELGEAGGDPQTGLAEFIIDNSYLSSYPHDFNLYDVIKSSIALDSLMPIYRSHLFVMAAHPPGGAMLTESQRREQLGNFFDDIYLNRDKQCMTCHNTTYSTTGIGDRTHPLYSSLDIALFDHQGGEYNNDINSDDYLDNCSSCHGDQAKGTDFAPGILGASASEIQNAISNVAAMNFLDSLGSSTVNDISAALEVGPFSGNNLAETVELNNAFFRTDFFELDDPSSSWGPWGIVTDCASINGVPSQGSIPGFLAGADDNYLSPIEIDEQFVTGVQKLDVQVASLPALNQSGVLDGDLAYAYRVAATITENIWEQLMGERLSISNQYARNAFQRNLLAYLTEEHFVKNDWSLKKVILEITTSKFFNRRSPEDSFANGPYELQAVFEPFVVEEDCRVNYSEEREDDPIDDIQIANDYTSGASRQVQRDLKILSNEPCFYNGQGDIVHRFAPRALVNSVARALDWPKPELNPGGSYPSEDLMKAIGQYWSSLEPGDKDVGFQSLLSWDDAYGTCPQKGEDWVEDLVLSIDIFNKANPLDPLTLEDIVFTMKDWLIQEPGYDVIPLPENTSREPVFLDPSTIPPSEQELLEKLFSMALDSKVDSQISSSTLRELCGVYLKTPQFMFAGIARNDNYELPRLRVCNAGSCNYKEMCNVVGNQLNILGYDTVCNNSSVSKPFVLTKTLKAAN